MDNCSQLHTHCCDNTADLLKEVCSNVTVDPPLQPLTEVLSMRTSIHREEARHRCKRFLGRPVWTSIFDVRVFNPSAPTNWSHQLTAIYHRHEQEKCRTYEQHVQEVERASFTPLVFGASGGMRIAATVFCKRLAALQQPYSTTIRWLRTALSFTLLRSAVLCLRGCHIKRSPPVSTLSIT